MGSWVERKRQGLRLQCLMRAHGAPGGGAALWGQAGGRGTAGPPPGRLLPCTGRPPTSSLHFCSTDMSQPGASPRHRPPRRLLELPAHRPGCGTGPPPRRSLGGRARGQGSRGWGCMASRAETVGGTLTVLGEEQDVVLGQVGPLDPLLKHTQEGITHGERADCVRDTRAPGHPRGGGLQGALGAGLCAWGCDLTPASPLPAPVLPPHLGRRAGAGGREERARPAHPTAPGDPGPPDIPYSFTDSCRARSRYKMAKPR